MERFRSKRICKCLVIIEMILSGASIFLAVGFFFAQISEPNEENHHDMAISPPGSNRVPKLQASPSSKLLWYGLQVLGLAHFLCIVLVFFAGQRVISEACTLSPQVMDIKKVISGVAACEFFCILEMIRAVLVLVGFFLELLLLSVSMKFQLIALCFNLPVIFGWFFTSEYRKELKEHVEELQTNRNLFNFIPPSVSFSGRQNFYNQECCSGTSRGREMDIGGLDSTRNGNQDFAETMMYSTPSIAYCINNLMK